MTETLQRTTLSKNGTTINNHPYDSISSGSLRRTSLGTNDDLISSDLQIHKRQLPRPTELISSTLNDSTQTGSGSGIGAGNNLHHTRRSSLFGSATAVSSSIPPLQPSLPLPPPTYPKPSSGLSNSSYAFTSSKDSGITGISGTSATTVTTSASPSSHLTNGPNALYATVNTNHRTSHQLSTSSSSQQPSNKKSVVWANQLANGSSINNIERQSKSILNSFDSPTDSYCKDKKFDD